MRKKKIFTNYKFKQLFVDKETKELVEFICAGFKGEDEVIALSNKTNKGFIFCPIEEFEQKYQIDKEFIALKIYKDGIYRDLRIDPLSGTIDKDDIRILASKAEKLLTYFYKECDWVVDGKFMGHQPSNK
jgi:hypothetical protein